MAARGNQVRGERNAKAAMHTVNIVPENAGKEGRMACP